MALYVFPSIKGKLKILLNYIEIVIVIKLSDTKNYDIFLVKILNFPCSYA